MEKWSRVLFPKYTLAEGLLGDSYFLFVSALSLAVELIPTTSGSGQHMTDLKI
jgi:hypothetical protein